MKVLQIINSLGTGGAEKLILDTLPLYRDKGIAMDVLLLWDNDCMFTQKLRELNCCTIHVLKKSNTYKDIYNLTHIFKIAKILREYDIAHVHLFPAQYFTVLANLFTGNNCKLLFTEHNTSNSRMQSKFFSSIDRFVYKGYKKIVAITQGVNEVLQHYLKAKTAQIVTIENGADIAKVKKALPMVITKIASTLSENDKIIVQVGGFRIQKDQDTTIRALLILPKNFHLLLVGDGERKEALQQLITHNNLNDRVHFLGQRTDVFSIIKSAKFVVVSSHWEGFGLAAVEGMAAKKPVLASNVKGLKEVVEGAGVLFERGNEKQLASIIKDLDSDDKYYNNVVEACLERVNQFDISIMVEKHIQLYTELYEV
jgi:glycosyltransferase involved in cell wall biosynthesis